MSLESVIADLIVALNCNTAAHTGGVVSAATATEEPKKRKQKELAAIAASNPEVVAPAVPSKEDLVAAINECIKVGTEHGEEPNLGTAAKLVIEVNKRNGTKRLSDAPEDKRSAIIAEFKAATAALKAQPAASSAI